MKISKIKLLIFFLLMLGLSMSCRKPAEVTPEIGGKTEPDKIPAGIRTKIEYNALAPKTAYDSLFLDNMGMRTVDLTEGNTLLKMFKELNTYLGKVSNENNEQLDSTMLKNLFLNSGNPFTDQSLNSSSLELRSITGSSKSNQNMVQAFFIKNFKGIDIASDSVLTTATRNKAGKLTASNGVTKLLVDTNGVEFGQLIQKSLIGALQLDYISNVLLSDSKLNADNLNLVPGKNYTELEHNWDVAFGILTLNKVYAINATNDNNGGESLLGGYTREYGNSGYGSDYLKIHPAFLKGRAAVVNNDMAEVKAQAAIIKSVFERIIARASIGYLNKWRAGSSNPGTAFRAMGEGLGMIYSLRFCQLSGGDDKFSDELLNDLIYSSQDGLWDLTAGKVNAVSDKIKTRFNLQ